MHHSKFPSLNISSLNAILNSYHYEISIPANFVQWDTVYATYTFYGIATADATRLAHFSTAVNAHIVFKDCLSSLFMLHPLPVTHTYLDLRQFIIAADRVQNMAAITHPCL